MLNRVRLGSSSCNADCPRAKGCFLVGSLTAYFLRNQSEIMQVHADVVEGGIEASKLNASPCSCCRTSGFKVGRLPRTHGK